MRRICTAWLVMGLLVTAWAIPGFAQPFKDGPAPVWAQAALAKLASEGLIQGYPDGTFRGNQPITRAEMAVIVARVLAKVESLEQSAATLPAPTRPQGTAPATSAAPGVNQADIELLLRLVNELKDELADLDLRIPAVEQDLNSIKARIDNVRITGTVRFRENVEASAASGSNPINGNPLTSTAPASQAPTGNQAQYEFKLNFDGFVTDELHIIIAAMTSGNTFQQFNSGSAGVATNAPLFGAQQAGTAFGNGAFGSLDSAFLDWKQSWGSSDYPSTFEAWVGRFGSNPQPNCVADCYPVQFGPFGLLMNDTGATWSDSTNDSGINQADGVRLAWHLPALADLQLQAVLLRVAGDDTVNDMATLPSQGNAYMFGEDAYGADANIQVNYWTRIGFDVVGNHITPNIGTLGPSGFGNLEQWHVYGPGGGAMNPANTGVLTPSSYHCVPASGGITCPAAGSGWGAYVDSDIISHVHVDGEYAQWNDSVFNTSDSGYQVNVTVDLADLTPIGHSASLQVGYVDYGENFYPPYGAAEADAAMNDTIYPGNTQGITGTISINPTDNTTVYFTYFGGQNISNSQQINEEELGLQYRFATNTQLSILGRSLSIAGVQQLLLYRAQVDYYF